MNDAELWLFRPGRPQQELAATARTVFSAVAPEIDPAALPGPGWRRLAESGLLGGLLPEDRGGLGLAPSDVAVLTEEAGYALVPGPLIETLWLAVPALGALGDAGSRRLAAVLAGTMLCSAVDETFRGPHLDVAELVVVPGPPGSRLVVPGSGELSRVPVADRLERSFRCPALDRAPGEPVPDGGGPTGPGPLALGRLAGAAYLLGIARRLLEATVRHVTDRTQFGVPIGSFQAVRHPLAEVHVEIEFARSAVWSAACEVDTGRPSAGQAITAAAVVARRAFAAADRHCLQAHGGIGFTWEHPLHGWIKRGHTFAHRFGNRWTLAAALGERVLEEAVTGRNAAPPRPAI